MIRRRNKIIFKNFYIEAITAVVLLASFFVLLSFKQHPKVEVPKLISSAPQSLYLYQASNSNYSVQIGSKDNPSPFLTFTSPAGSQATFSLYNSTSTKTEKTNNSILYKDIKKDTDLTYTPQIDGVKEEIIINKPTDDSSYLFSLDTKNARPRIISKDQYSNFFYNDKGTYQFHIEKPFAIDAKGVRTEDISFTIRKSKDANFKYQIQLSLSQTWLKDKNRAYPVKIDPTVVYNTSSQFAAGLMNRIKDTGAVSSANTALATGGTITNVGDYVIHTFTSGTSSFTPSTTMNVEVLVVAGGGGGSSGGSNVGSGGGGGGGVIYNSSYAVTSGTPVTVTVGAGGGIGANNAGHSIFDTLDATGGGTGGGVGAFAGVGQNGGSGGGSAGANKTVGTGIGGQGFAGGLGFGTYGVTTTAGGGGGGAGAVGAAATSASAPGAGGAGLNYSINGTSTTYAKGGDGAPTSGTAGVAGAANTGNGGGGGAGNTQTGGVGGSGIVIVRYRAAQASSDVSPALETYYQELPSDQYTVGLWHFNELSSIPLDSSGNSFNLTLVGTDINTITPILGSASRILNGISDYMYVADNDKLDPQDITIEAWIKPSGFQTGNFVDKGDNSGYRFRTLVTGAIQFLDRGGTNFITSSSKIPLGVWTHVAVTGDDSGLKIYINGELDIQNNVAYGGPNTSTALVMGAYGSSAEWFNGYIDEVRISNIARSAEEIRLDALRRPYGVYTSPVISLSAAKQNAWNPFLWTAQGMRTGDGETLKDTTGLIAQWNMNNTSGTTATNDAGSCGAPCNGTLTNFASTGSQDAATNSGWTVANKRWGAGAIMLDGANDTVTLGTESNYDFERTNSFSLEAWIKTSSPTQQGIISKLDSNSPNSGYELTLNGDGTIGFVISNTWVTNALVVTTNGNQSIIDGKWHHVVATYSGNSLPSGIHIYIDGVNQTFGINFSTLTSSILNNINPYIGSRNNVAFYFKGVIDSTRVYSRALTPAEILSNYNSSNIEFQTRVGYTADPNDGSWENWAPISSETTIDNMNNPIDYATPSARIFNGALLATSSSTFPLIEGNKDLKIQSGLQTGTINTIALWHLDETDGTGAFIKDSTGNGNNATASGTTVVNGISGKARNFNGSTDFIAIPHQASQNSLPITIEAWFKSGDSGVNTILNKYVSGSTNGYAVYLSSGGIFLYYFNSGTNYISNFNTTYGSGYNDNKWHHVAVTVSSTDGATTYVDGVALVTNVWVGTATVPTTTRDISIGRYPSPTGTYSSFFNGSIDEVRISNVVRTPEEIGESYRLGRDHYINKTIASTDLSAKTSLPFYIAADRPGTYLNAIVGNSAYANYQPDANTAALLHLDEKVTTAFPGPSTYLYTGGAQTYVVPAGVTSITVKAWGAGGGGGSGLGGGGGYASSVISVTPGESITVDVGGGGGLGTTCILNGGQGAGGGGAYGTGGAGGASGPAGCSGGGAGGGAGSFVLRSATVLLAAGGGGGGGGGESGSGLYAGGGGGVAGTNSACSGVGGGTGTSGSVNGAVGGHPAAIDSSGSGGGGGGLNGGSGGTANSTCDGPGAGGGGGANSGTTVANGSGSTPGNSTDPDRGGLDGKGGFSYVAGQNGRIVIYPAAPASNYLVRDSSGNSNNGLLGTWNTGFVGTSTSFSYTGGAQTYIVPPGVSAIIVKVWGGGGGGGGNTGAAGGGGAYVNSTLSVTPGEPITVYVGNGGGAGATTVTNTGGGTGGFGTGTGGRGGNAGTTGTSAGGGGGGGGSSVTRGAITLSIAGGGGGGGGAESTGAGAGGGGGVNGTSGTCSSVGGTTGGNSSSAGGQGGDRGAGDGSGAGGGGGGLIGGTGALPITCDTTGAGGGGGGSSFGTTVTNGSGATPGNSADADRGTSGNGGGTQAAGTAGKVVIYSDQIPFAQGIFGRARIFNGTTDAISIANASSLQITGALTLEAWINTSATANYQGIIGKMGTGSPNFGYLLRENISGAAEFGVSSNGSAYFNAVGSTFINDGKWHHIVGTYVPSTSVNIYVDGVLQKTNTTSIPASLFNSNGNVMIGSSYMTPSEFFTGTIDEVRISNVTRTADQIRQAYEVGLRTHTITIDFGADLDSGNLIADSTDKSFTVDATYYGLSQKGSALYLGDKIIIRENYNGTEYIAQGTVNAVNISSGAVTVSAWDTGSTFPSVGFTTNASVFKWQREYWPVAGNTLSTHMNAITNLTLRVTDGDESRSIWVDDLKSSSGYLSNPAGSTMTSGLGNRYVQFRSIFTSIDPAVSATLAATTIDYTPNSAPNIPALDLPTNGAISQSLSPVFKTTGTDPESDYLMYQIRYCTDSGMTIGCNNYDQSISQAGWSGQNASSSTAYNSGSQATFTLPVTLAFNTTYYWKTSAMDPNGSANTGSVQVTPYSFTTNVSPNIPTLDVPTDTATNQLLLPVLKTTGTDNDSDYLRYKIQICTDAPMTVACQTFDQTLSQTGWSGQNAQTSTAYNSGTQATYTIQTALAPGTTYYWRSYAIDQGATNLWGATQAATHTFTTSAIPNTPSLDLPTNLSTGITTVSVFKTTATDPNSDYLRYKIVVCVDPSMSFSCQTFDQTSSQTGWSGQNTMTGTAYTSTTQATYTVQTPLQAGTTYYWKSYAIDPGGSNTWGTTQGTPFSFTTKPLPESPSSCTITKATDNSSIRVNWVDVSHIENGYQIWSVTDGGAPFHITPDLAPDIITYLDSTVISNHSYGYMIRSFYYDGSNTLYSNWCFTPSTSMSIGHFYVN